MIPNRQSQNIRDKDQISDLADIEASLPQFTREYNEEQQELANGLNTRILSLEYVVKNYSGEYLETVLQLRDRFSSIDNESLRRRSLENEPFMYRFETNEELICKTVSDTVPMVYTVEQALADIKREESRQFNQEETTEPEGIIDWESFLRSSKESFARFSEEATKLLNETINIGSDGVKTLLESLGTELLGFAKNLAIKALLTFLTINQSGTILRILFMLLRGVVYAKK